MNPYLLKQYQLHPSMQSEDVLKLTFQATFGAEHLLADFDIARKYLYQEFEETEAEDLPLYEEISEEYSRLNIAAWKYHQRSKEEYFDLFIASLPKVKKTKEDFIALAKENIETMKKVWSQQQVEELISLSEKLLSDLHPIHHSQKYREQENPHYRLVRTDLIETK